MGIESISSGAGATVGAPPTPAVQRSDDSPRRRGEPYGKYLRRLSLDGLIKEQKTQQQEYARYGKDWFSSDVETCCARRGEPAYPIFVRLQAIAAEFGRTATPAPAAQGTGDPPRRRGEPYGKYLRRLSLDGLINEQKTQQREYAQYGKDWFSSDVETCCARRGEPGYLTFGRLQAIGAEFRRRYSTR